jgi:hypothetical protein
MQFRAITTTPIIGGHGERWYKYTLKSVQRVGRGEGEGDLSLIENKLAAYLSVQTKLMKRLLTDICFQIKGSL